MSFDKDDPIECYLKTMFMLVAGMVAAVALIATFIGLMLIITVVGTWMGGF